MTVAMLWWIATALAVLAELATGTFYLLMIALGLAGGALAAHAAAPLAVQFVVAGALGAAGVLAWQGMRRRRQPPPASQNHDVLLDVGERVDVAAWDAAGRAHVRYRGADWQARWVGAGEPAPGEHVIQSLEGNVLCLVRAARRTGTADA